MARTSTWAKGDRLFISLLGTAFILMAWLLRFGPPFWNAGAVFRWV